LKFERKQLHQVNGTPEFAGGLKKEGGPGRNYPKPIISRKESGKKPNRSEGMGTKIEDFWWGTTEQTGKDQIRWANQRRETQKSSGGKGGLVGIIDRKRRKTENRTTRVIEGSQTGRGWFGNHCPGGEINRPETARKS